MKIAFMNSFAFDPKIDRLHTYRPLMQSFLQRVWPEAEITTFECPQDEFPKKLQFDLFVFGGSPKASYEPDHWILRQKKLIRALHERKKKMLGICFGHQLLAAALGGEVEAYEEGWEVGSHSSKTTSPSDLLGMQTGKDFSLLYIHQDQVTRLPENAKNLASNDFCAHQIFTLDDNVLGIQGHPEFNSQYLTDLLEYRREDLGETLINQAVESLESPRDENSVIEWIRSFSRKR